MEKHKMIIFAVLAVSVLVVAAVALTNNEGTSDTNTADGNNEGSPATGDSNTGTNAQASIVGNWTFVNSTTNGELVTHIASGWVSYKDDGTWTYSFDYGYTIVNDEGTWQAQDGKLYWGTEGHEISDWYSVDNYEVIGDDLIVSTDEGTRAVYRRS